MPKPGFLRYLIFLLLLFIASAYAQSSGELARLYRDDKISELRELCKKDLIKSSDWKVFVDALFETDGERAVQKMLEAYSYSNDSKLKDIIRKRVSLYYSARGYYETSRRITDDESFFENIVSLKQTSSSPGSSDNRASEGAGDNEYAGEDIGQISENGQTFGIQVGAYSTYDNARRASRKYLSAYSNTRVLIKPKTGLDLYVVVIGGYPTREEAASKIDEISNRFKVKGYIVQY